MTSIRSTVRLFAAVSLVAVPSMLVACSDSDDGAGADPPATDATTSTRPPTTAPSTGEPVGGDDSTDFTSSVELQATELDTLLQFESYSVGGNTITGRFNAANLDADVDSQCVLAMDTVEPGTSVVLSYPDREVTCDTR